MIETPLFDALQVNQAERGTHLPARLPPPEDSTGEELKEIGLENAMKPKASKVYQGRLEDALLHFPVRSRVTIEQLTGIAGRPETWGARFNSTGAIVNGMAKRGLIQKTGRMLQAQRPGMHLTETAEWEVLKYANVGKP